MFWRLLCAEAQLSIELYSVADTCGAVMGAQCRRSRPCLSVSSDAIAEVSVRRLGMREKRRDGQVHNNILASDHLPLSFVLDLS